MSAKPSGLTEEDQPLEETSRAAKKDRNRGFTAWRRRRPFAAGLFMILSGIVMLVPAYLSFEVSNIQVQISTLSGVSTLLLGILLITCGISTWVREEGRILTGVAAMILGIVALPAANFGGFILGTLLALIGGAMALSWAPDERLRRKELKRLHEAEDDEIAADDDVTEEYEDQEPVHDDEGYEGYSDVDETPAVEEHSAADTKEIDAVTPENSRVGSGVASPVGSPAVEAQPEHKSRWRPSGSSKWKHGGTTTVIAFLTALAVGTGTHLNNAEAQLPNIQLPGLPVPPAQPGQQPQQQADPNTTPGQPVLPTLPTIPGLPPLPTDIPGLPQLPPASSDPLAGLPKEFSGLALPKIGGLDTDPPAPIPGMGLPSGTPYTVKADKTTLLGNVKLSYITLDTALGPKPAIRIDADRVILDNLQVNLPGMNNRISDIWQRSGPGDLSTLNGNFHIIVASLDVVPQLAGVPLPFNVPISASAIPEDIGVELKKVGAGLPDQISEQTVMLNGTMETYYISADDLVEPASTTISP